MEGITPTPSGTLPSRCFALPYLTEDRPEEDHVSLHDLPRHRGVPPPTDTARLHQHFASTKALAAFMQSWLFFGLLKAFLRRPIRHADFVSNGRIQLAQDAVESHFHRWKDTLWKASYAKKRTVQKNAEDAIRFAVAQCEALEAAEYPDNQGAELGRVALSVHLLAGLLLAMLEDTFSKTTGAWTPWAVSVSRKWYRLTSFYMMPWGNFRPSFANEYISEMKPAELVKTLYGNRNVSLPVSMDGAWHAGPAATCLLRTFEANGWCPFRARQLCQALDYIALNSLAGIVKEAAAEGSHGRCLEAERCTAHDVIGLESDIRYAFRHDPENCDGQCDFVSIPFQQLADIIMSGDKPIISVAIDGPLDLQVVRCTPSLTYTAISHVWSDGRGNPGANALPTCQVRWLRDSIHRTYHPEYSPFYNEDSPFDSTWEFHISQALAPGRPHTSIHKKRIYFWMDTLCIPVCPPAEADDRAKKLRFRAIKQISPIFTGAYNALILDRSMETSAGHNLVDLTGDEFAGRVLGSTWLERGWTLQEGSLSHRCVVQLQGKPFEMNIAMRNRMPPIDTTTSPLVRATLSVRRATTLLLKRELLEYKRHIMFQPLFYKAKRLSRMLQAPLFVWTWNSLINRSCTRSSDAVLIFASLLDFDVYHLRPIPQKMRLMRIIQGLEEIPLSLLYNTGPRVSINGCPHMGWLPEDVRGDRLVAGAILRKLKSKKASHPVIYSFERGYQGSDSLLTFTTLWAQSIHPTARVVHAFVQDVQQGTNSSLEYIISIHRESAVDRSVAPSVGHVVVIDLSYGTNTLRGIAGKGVLFSITSRAQGTWIVKYEAPLIIRAPEQWVRRTGTSPLPDDSVVMQRVPRRQKIHLAFDESLWKDQLTRRPLYTMYPLWTSILAIVLSLVVAILIIIPVGWLVNIKLKEMGWLPKMPINVVKIVLVLTWPILVAMVFTPVRNRTAMLGYKRWLRTFDEPPDGEDDEDIERSMPQRSVVSWWTSVERALRVPRRTVTWLMKKALPGKGRRRRGNDVLEVGDYPEEIYLA